MTGVVRALWLILARRIPADALLALAFGEQAATELKERLRAKLEEIARTAARDALDPEVVALAPNEPLVALRAREERDETARLVYVALTRARGRLIVGDYKLSSSAQVPPEEASAYSRAASSAIGQSAEFQIISLGI
ncbi:MAG: hypothetical protein AAB368_02380 [bacterium]